MPRRKLFWLPALILLIGWGLRLKFIRLYGLEPDETFTLGVAQHSATYLIQNFLNPRVDIHSSLYPLIIHFWKIPAGISEIALRFPNALAEMITGALLMHAARKMSGSRAALIVGVLWAINPLAISGVSLTRGHSLMSAFALIAWVAMLHALIGTRRRALFWAIFAISALMTAYLHAVGLFALAGLMAVGGIWVLRKRWDAALALIITGGGYLPYLLLLIEQQGTRVVETKAGMTLPDFATYLSGLLIANQVFWDAALLWFLLGLLLIMLIAAYRAPNRAWMIALWITLAVYIVGIAYRALGPDIFKGRYFVYVSPLAVLGVALGIAHLPARLIRSAALSVFLIAGGAGLVEAHHPSARDDFVAVAQFLNLHADSGDVIFVMSSYAEPVVRYYYHGEARIVGVEPFKNLSPEAHEATFAQAEGYDTAWLVLHANLLGDPDDAFNGWFRERYPLRTEIFPAGATVHGYDLRPTWDRLPSEATPLDVIYADKLALRGYQVYVDQVIAHDDRLHPPSGWVHVTLYWEALEAGITFEPRLRIEDDQVRLWGLNFVRGSESHLRYPPTTWQRGDIWRTDFDINLNPATPPSIQKIVLQVVMDGVSVPISDGTNVGNDWLILDVVTIK